MSSIPPPPQEPPQYYQQSPFQPQKKSNVGLIVAIILVAGACLIIPIMGAILFPVFSQAKSAAKKTQALSNIKICATAMAIYSADFDDYYPHTMADSQELYGSLQAYIKDEKTWNTFGNPTQGNPNLAAKPIFEQKNLSSLITLYNIPKEISPKAVVAAGDSSAQVVDANDLKLEISGNTFRIPSK
jgi:type II secretory pathway pseudopilin PulG